MKNLNSLEFPKLPDNFNKTTFDQLRWEVKKVIFEIVKRQKKIQFNTKNKLRITDKMWNDIYVILQQYLSWISDERLNDIKNITLSPFFVSKLHLTFWDKDIVLLLSILLIVYILSVSENQVNTLVLENEIKITWIDVKELHRKILELWWVTKSRWLITDMYFDRYIPWTSKCNKNIKPKWLLWLDGRQIRSRQKFSLDTSSEIGFSQKNFISGKRELTNNEKTKDWFKGLRALFDTIEQDVSFKDVSQDMKLLFEEEMKMNAQTVFEDILQIIKINNSRAKIKQRVSDELQLPIWNAKIEANEDYFWAQSNTSPTWFIPPFAEFELPLWSDPRELLEDILWLRNYNISKAGSKKFFQEQWANEAYLNFMRWLQKDNETMRKLLQYESQWRQAIVDGYYRDFPERLAV